MWKDVEGSVPQSSYETKNILQQLRAEIVKSGRKLIVLDDDPTGVQTVHGISVYTDCLSDEYCQEGTFTGAFVGVCCQDMSGCDKHADFDWFEYVEV